MERRRVPQGRQRSKRSRRYLLLGTVVVVLGLAGTVPIWVGAGQPITFRDAALHQLPSRTSLLWSRMVVVARNSDELVGLRDPGRCHHDSRPRSSRALGVGRRLGSASCAVSLLDVRGRSLRAEAGTSWIVRSVTAELGHLRWRNARTPRMDGDSEKVRHPSHPHNRAGLSPVRRSTSC